MNGLPLRNKILYSMGWMGSSSVFYAISLWLVYLYAPPPESGRPVLVPLFWIGVVFAIGRFIEAFDDPLIGHWSDVTRSRWGRRAPFIIFGMPFMALFFFLLWLPPHNHESILNAVYFFIVLELFYLASTIVLGPYDAILPEIATAPSDRVNIASWGVLFGAVGTALALVVSPFLVESMGFKAMGLAIGGVALATIYLGLMGARNHMRFEHHPADINFLEGAKATLTNPAFLAFSAGFILFNSGFNLLVMVMPFWVRVVMGQSEGKVAWFTGVILAILLVSLPLMNTLAAWRSKKWAYAAGMLALAAYMPFWYWVGFLPVVPPIVQGLVYVGLAGIPFAAVHVFPNPLMADVIDHDEVRTGQRREAVYYGMQQTLKKASVALSTGLFTVVLLLGSTVENPLGIRLMGPVAAMAVALGFIIFTWGYRLPDVVASIEEPRAAPLGD